MYNSPLFEYIITCTVCGPDTSLSELRCWPNTHRTPLPPSPSHSVPLPGNIMEEAVVKAVRSILSWGLYPNTIPTESKSPEGSHSLPLPDCGNNVLSAITGTVSHLCARCIYPDVIFHLHGHNVCRSRGGHDHPRCGNLPHLYYLVHMCYQ